MGRPRGDTRERLIRGAFESLRTRGYASSSSRAVGQVAGVNPALVFYYFESVDDLLVTALAESNTDRLARYRAAIEGASSPSDLVAVLAKIYREDVSSGQIAVVSELVAASVSKPELAARVTELMEPWVELAEAAIESLFADSPLRELASARTIALVAVVFYLGANLLTQLLPEGSGVDALLEDAARLAPLLDTLVLTGGDGS